MKKVYEIGGLPHFQQLEEDISAAGESLAKKKHRSKFHLVPKFMKREKNKEKERSPAPSGNIKHDLNVKFVLTWIDRMVSMCSVHFSVRKITACHGCLLFVLP